jgi:hypothetical protein
MLMNYDTVWDILATGFDDPQPSKIFKGVSPIGNWIKLR